MTYGVIELSQNCLGNDMLPTILNHYLVYSWFINNDAILYSHQDKSNDMSTTVIYSRKKTVKLWAKEIFHALPNSLRIFDVDKRVIVE